MTMMVDSGLAGSLTPAAAGAATPGGAPAQTGIAALFAALMGSVARPAASPAPDGVTAALPDGTPASPPAAIAAPVLTPAMTGTPSLAAEMTTYLDQIETILEPKMQLPAAVVLPVAHPAVAREEEAPTDLPAQDVQASDPSIDTPVQIVVDPSIAFAPATLVPVAMAQLPAEAPRSTQPVSLRAKVDDAPEPIVKPTTISAFIPPATDAEAPPPPDLAAAIAAFAQQPKPADKAMPTPKPTHTANVRAEGAPVAVTPSIPVRTNSDSPLPDISAPVPSPATGVMAATPQSPLSVAPASQPVADIGGMLGQQVIDMGSGGQWIDGLAREIAALGRGEGQGSFRLSPEHLGPMRVDIRTGDQGASVTLTVETQAAEAMLVQDRHLLKADAQLSALRIGDVTVERVAHVAEAGRSDSTAGQGASGQQGNNAQNAALAQGQSQNNGHSAANRKVPDPATVSSEAEPRGTEDNAPSDTRRRARYA